MSRLNKISDQIRDTVSIQFSAGRVHDPRLQNIGITAVKVTADLGQATIYFRNYSATKIEDVEIGLAKASGYLKQRVAKSIYARRVPNLRFKFDKSIEVGARIEKILQDIRY